MIRHALLSRGHHYLLALRSFLRFPPPFSFLSLNHTFPIYQPSGHSALYSPRCPDTPSFRTTEHLKHELVGQAPREREGETLDQCRQRIMKRYQYSEEETDIRIISIQAMLGPPIPPPISPTPPAQYQDNDPQPPTKVTFIDFDLNSVIGDRIPHTPSQYAIGKIQNMEYVELWYFTTEGCKEVSKVSPSTSDNAFGFLNTDSGLALQTCKAANASHNAIADEHLTWEQIMTARHTMITTTTQVGWPKKHTLALAGQP